MTSWMNPCWLLEELVARPSVNPAFVPVGDPSAGEARVAEFITGISQKAGLDVERQEVFPGRHNILVRLVPSKRVRHRIVLAPHMDTVGVSNPGQFKPARKAGRLHGRGACDTKGSVAMMWGALLHLTQSPQRPHSTEVVLAALVDEESMQGGSRFLAQSRLKADLAIVGEPTELKIVTAHKGDLWLELSVEGKAAHGSRPELGDNAIHKMSKVVQLLESRYAAQLRKKRHRLLGHATINVGMIQGGRQPNIVPDHCSIRIDRRTIPGERDPAVKREIVRFIGDHGLKVRLEDTKAEEPAPPLETDSRLPFVEKLLHAARQRQPAGVDFFTDAGVLSAAGIPSVVLGPGNIAQAHTEDEWVELRQVEEGLRLLCRFLQALP